ncbi:copper resistance system multicopper oxidase [Salinisphaera hydrothermalis]|uniref:copper resistance system multicopper oxidase n=1 Tax=Salinisphaera hydrothermalis TaxID=563188 RepID=UPI00333EC3FF
MNDQHTNTQRRRLLQAMGASGLLAGLDMFLPGVSRAEMMHRAGEAARVKGGTPRSVTQDFHIRREGISVAGGRASSAYTINHSIPGPIVELWEGHDALLRIHNHIPDEITSIHWHGILLPFQMDGVPGVTFPGIDPGETFEAHFPVRQYGTYWYHSHAGTQEQNCQTGPMVIHPADDRDRVPADREYVVVLNDWTFEDPQRVLAKLKEMSDYYNFSRRTVPDFIEDAQKAGLKKTLADRLAWANMRMSPRDIADVTGHTYTYLMNGQHPAANWTGIFQPGERVKLRVINASAMTYFNFRIPGLPMTVVSADGQNVEPVDTDEFQIAVAETFDVVVEPKADQAYTIMVESMDRSGYARGTLAPRAGMSAPVPALRHQPQRTMVDMGMDMQKMGMGKMPAPRHGEDRGSAMGHGMPMAHDAGAGQHTMGTGTMMEKAGPVVMHQKGENPYGPGNIFIAHDVRYRLAERGTGLEGIDHRVLTYSQLRNVKPMRDKRTPSKTIELHLTGNMDRYMWSFDGKEYSSSTPIHFPYNHRIRLVLINDTMMEHPIHLHGQFMELENEQGEYLPFKHTISVLPASRVSLLVTADEPGRWFFHCHLLYHLEMGMARVVVTSDQQES